MPVDNLTDLNNIITGGTAPERLAFKNIIVSGLNAQDIADIITASTREQKEAMAVLVRQAESFKADTDSTTAQAAHDAAVVVAQSWYDTVILPTLLWVNTDTLELQRENNLLDRATLQGLLGTETDEFRIIILRNELAANLAQFKAIKIAILASI